MKSYEFLSVWRFDAPLDKVWSVIKDHESWPDWWPGAQALVELEPGDDDGIGAVHHSGCGSGMTGASEVRRPG